ncbi:hypothetical protein [Kitasatospora purpeofusca]|uniref:hypothetical protein n=1 Tax=Kitasatospora purpeofusca TaxID=67352 RepID=UPI0037F4DED0
MHQRTNPAVMRLVVTSSANQVSGSAWARSGHPVIPGLHRFKGGILRLGLAEPGLFGPLGTWTDQDGEADEHDPADDDLAGPHS